VLEAGRGAPLVYLHGAGCLFQSEPLLERLSARFHVFAPEWPGYGVEGGEEKLEDMLDFALHGWDVVDALGLDSVRLVGHSMGGMIAAEMACIANHALDRLALIAPAGLWLDAHPIPDLFSMLPFELVGALFADLKNGEKFLTGGIDFGNPEALQQFLVTNARRLGTAGKILFPIPNRRIAKRLYRLVAPTLLVWGSADKLIPLPYAERWRQLVPHARLSVIEGGAHMVPYEHTEPVAVELERFLSGA
ncbi:MAG TPA: alpha/beta hydrolase, partial [Myxococcota bacterium]|nr:alpha/beta hydrolase [Myxococcota bacterium]